MINKDDVSLHPIPKKAHWKLLGRTVQQYPLLEQLFLLRSFLLFHNKSTSSYSLLVHISYSSWVWDNKPGSHWLKKPWKPWPLGVLSPHLLSWWAWDQLGLYEETHLQQEGKKKKEKRERMGEEQAERHSGVAWIKQNNNINNHHHQSSGRCDTVVRI